MEENAKVFAKYRLTMEKQQIINISNSMGGIEGKIFITYVRCMRRFLVEDKRLFGYVKMHSKTHPCSITHSIFSAFINESIKYNRMPTIRRAFVYGVSKNTLCENDTTNAFARISPRLLGFMRNLYHVEWR